MTDMTTAVAFEIHTSHIDYLGCSSNRAPGTILHFLNQSCLRLIVSGICSVGKVSMITAD